MVVCIILWSLCRIYSSSSTTGRVVSSSTSAEEQSQPTEAAQAETTIRQGEPTSELKQDQPAGEKSKNSKNSKKPLYDPAHGHPAQQLITEAEERWQTIRRRQSKTLEEAVTEYKRRYGIAPPPHFDKWYAFAKKRNVVLVDEFDEIEKHLAPFWGLKPSTIRARSREALGGNNNLLAVSIRNGTVTNPPKYDADDPKGRGREFLSSTIPEMLRDFVNVLPDMDLCFNIHDEPRVVVQTDDLARLYAKSIETKAQAAASQHIRNSWSQSPAELGDGIRIPAVMSSRFNTIAHQNVWSISRMSCPTDSPARELEDGVAQDNTDSHAFTELGHIYNHTAFTDVCQNPSHGESHGFFLGPNAMIVTHDLLPVFSMSKPSSYADIPYPSPWYWADKVTYNAKWDMAWSKKSNDLYWRGGTSGGYSRNGLWRKSHRQRFVQTINSKANANLFLPAQSVAAMSEVKHERDPVAENSHSEDTHNESSPNEKRASSEGQYELVSQPRSNYESVVDVAFTIIEQCNEGDCAAQESFFDIKERAEFQKAWAHKLLVDIDGNAYSARYYPFLRSNSLVLKLNIFMEWHRDWLQPWLHYIPLSMKGGEWLDLVRWFTSDKDGMKEAERLASVKQEWAEKVLRKEDMEVWFYRLLLE